MIVTTATRRPAMIVGTASGNSTRTRSAFGETVAVRCVDDVRGHPGQAGEGVREQDEQGVGHQRDLDGRVLIPVIVTRISNAASDGIV